MCGLEGNKQSRTEYHPRNEIDGTYLAPPHAVLSNRNVMRDATSNREASERADSQTAPPNRVPPISASRILRLAIFLLIRDSAFGFKSAARAARQSPCVAATVRVVRPPIVRDAARENRRDNVSRRGNSASASTLDRRISWGVEARGGRSCP